MGFKEPSVIAYVYMYISTSRKRRMFPHVICIEPPLYLCKLSKNADIVERDITGVGYGLVSR